MLISKLEKLKPNTKLLLHIIKELLIDRQQRVSIKHYLSDPEMVHSGVTQGLLLSPLLFKIFMSDHFSQWTLIVG